MPIEDNFPLIASLKTHRGETKFIIKGRRKLIQNDKLDLEMGDGSIITFNKDEVEHERWINKAFIVFSTDAMVLADESLLDKLKDQELVGINSGENHFTVSPEGRSALHELIACFNDKEQELNALRESNSSEPKVENKIVNALGKELMGVWASESYKKQLWKQNSISAIEDTGNDYTDLVFDGTDAIHCGSAMYMEPDYLFLKPDATIANHKGELCFAITLAKGDSLHLLDTAQRLHRFFRVKKEIDVDRVFLEVIQGRRMVHNEWMAGDYRMTTDSFGYDLKIWPDGRIKSDQAIKTIVPFSYMQRDLVEFEFNDHDELYLFERYPDGSMNLKAVEDIREEGAPIVETGKKAYLERKQGA